MPLPRIALWAASSPDNLYFLEMTLRARRAARPAPVRKPRRPPLASLIKQAREAGIEVARCEIKADGSINLITGKGEPVAPENPWPLDEFRRERTKR
jgi:hypothetical protein